MYGAEKQGVIHHFLSIFVRTPPMLAWTSPQGLVPPSSHANSARIIPSRRRPCWRGPPRKASFHRRSTPTGPGFSRAGAAHVGVGLPARPCSTVKPRQQCHRYPEPAPPMLAWTSPQGLVSPPCHANRARIILSRRRPCWRGPPRKALIHRQATPTWAFAIDIRF